MSKRFISLMLLFLFTMGMAVPASANCEAADFLPINIEDLEVLDENSGEVSLDVAIDPEKDLAPASYIQLNSDLSLYLMQVATCPIIAFLNNDGSATTGVLQSVKRYMNFPANKTQSDSMKLTSAQLQSVENEVDAWVASSPYAGKAYAIIGWHVGIRIHYSASNPQYVEYWATATNSTNGATVKETLSNTSGSYDMFRNIAIPSGLSESYYRVGISGNFYFTRSSGQVGGFAFGGGVVMNSDKNPYQ